MWAEPGWAAVPGRLAFHGFCLAIAANLHRVVTPHGDRHLALLGLVAALFSVISEVPYRMFIEDADTLNVLPTLALGCRLPGLAAKGVS